MTEARLPNPTLNAEQLVEANKLLDLVRGHIEKLAGGSSELLFAYRRKVAKELVYDERSKPMARRRLKLAKRNEQGSKCAGCLGDLPDADNVLDRISAIGGYTATNTRLLCRPCDTKIQEERGFR